MPLSPLRTALERKEKKKPAPFTRGFSPPETVNSHSNALLASLRFGGKTNDAYRDNKRQHAKPALCSFVGISSSIFLDPDLERKKNLDK